MDAGLRADGQSLRIQRIDNRRGGGAVYAEGVVQADISERDRIAQEGALQLAGRSALSAPDAHHARAQDAALAHGQRHARIQVGDGMAERAVALRLRVVKGERAHARGAVAHPKAQPPLAVQRVLRGLHRGFALLAPARVAHLQRGSALRGQHLRELCGAEHALPVNRQQQVARPQSRLAPRAGAALSVHLRQPYHQNALCVERRADGLAAGVENLFAVHLHGDLLDRHAQQRYGQVRLPRLRADDPDGFVRRGQHLRAHVGGLQRVGPADRDGIRLARAHAQRFRQRAYRLRLRGIIGQDGRQG